MAPSGWLKALFLEVMPDGCLSQKFLHLCVLQCDNILLSDGDGEVSVSELISDDGTLLRIRGVDHDHVLFCSFYRYVATIVHVKDIPIPQDCACGKGEGNLGSLFGRESLSGLSPLFPAQDNGIPFEAVEIVKICDFYLLFD